MKFCDITIAYNSKSGGIKTYIDAKRRFLRERTNYEHLLIIPGKRDRVRRSGRTTTVTLRGPLLPAQNEYRFFLSPARIKQVLMEEQPDIVELGSYYTEPWAAFSYRRRRRAEGEDCLIGAFFHTDVAQAYVASPLKSVAHNWLDVSEALAGGVETIADLAAAGAESYMRKVFTHCDLALASSPAQAARLQEYGVDDVEIVPMGVDVNVFTPRRRAQSLRARLGAGQATTVLVYAGRLSTEKRIATLLEAFGALPRDFDARLWIMGEGPLREDVERATAEDKRIQLLQYEGRRERFAEMLASADIYVTAGPFETFGLSVIEAQACGLPVVGVDAGALRERVGDGLGLLGPVDDANVMAANIVRAAAQRDQMGARARGHIVENFSWRHAFKRLMDCYAERDPRLSAFPAPMQQAGAEPERTPRN